MDQQNNQFIQDAKMQIEIELNQNKQDYPQKESNIMSFGDFKQDINDDEKDQSHQSSPYQGANNRRQLFLLYPTDQSFSKQHQKQIQKALKKETFSIEKDSIKQSTNQNQSQISSDKDGSSNLDRRFKQEDITDDLYGSLISDSMRQKMKSVNQRNLELQSPETLFKEKQKLKCSILINHQKVINSTVQKRPNFLNVLFYVTVFSNKMKLKANFKQFQKLTINHFQLINDISYVLKSEFDKLVKKQVCQIFDKVQIFSPSSHFVVGWHIVILCILFVQLFFIPLKAGFQLHISNGFWLYFLRLVPATVFIIEIILCFNTGYYEEGQIITQRSKIIKNYIAYKFWIDICATGSIIINQSLDSSILDFVQFLHIQQMTEIINYVDDHFQISQRFQTIFELIKLTCLILVVAHYCGCAFHFVGQIQIDQGVQDTWIQVKTLVDSDWRVRYLNSLYYAFITMNTVGYGDITPNTSVEKIFVICMTVVSCGVFGYAINTIGSIVREIALKEAAFKQTKFDISMYMRNRNISRSVQIKVFKSLEYINQQEIEGSTKASNILETVSQSVREEVYKEFYGKILLQQKLFRFNFSEKFINALSLKMKEVILGPGEIIYNQNDTDSRIYFIIKGEVELYVKQKIEFEKEKIFSLTKINSNNFFGHTEFFTDQQRQVTSQTLTSCNLVYLSNKDVMEVIENYEEDYQNFCKLKDNLLLYGNQIDYKCLSCNQFTHSILECPLIHLNLDKQFVIRKSMHYVKQKSRKAFIRKNQRTQNTLSQLDEYKYRLKYFRSDIVVDYRPEYIHFDFNDEYQLESDQEFFMRTPKFRFKGEQSFEIISNFSGEDIDIGILEEETNQWNQSDKNSKYKLTTQNSIKDQFDNNFLQNSNFVQTFNQGAENDIDNNSSKNNMKSYMIKQPSKDTFQKRKITSSSGGIVNENSYFSQRSLQSNFGVISISSKQSSQKNKSQAQEAQKVIDYITFHSINNFEIRKDFKQYFPHNNLTKILEKLVFKQQQKMIITVKTAFNIGNLKKRQPRTDYQGLKFESNGNGSSIGSFKTFGKSNKR